MAMYFWGVPPYPSSYDDERLARQQAEHERWLRDELVRKQIQDAAAMTAAPRVKLAPKRKALLLC